ncbi:hypothetical protein HMPREF0766_11541 [Sphingobacterium spiritivorum ATCC 33861]|uniref:Uncharacterized protein n=1 Tax=Sphingobacterium spiritivorum ATCC 33861 TaxID=525373 RepID=D7VKM2_SPHSI|nr:hypothetical protein HMPREF0766_11541 [Sphingobacterium spiritivorum ATCC 33861]
MEGLIYFFLYRKYADLLLLLSQISKYLKAQQTLHKWVIYSGTDLIY